ncbi:UNVERIFIED_CONTAM: G-type lectin S-receptor-like serine/threonine-protein kinase [Sesamum angustifolium]|uniref:non-specific serine/threonine protein kinase n=1 Tax=Sesamum angustifolium TaxID=2727405 RepID=A0AAW2JC56_9LAMI
MACCHFTTFLYTIFLAVIFLEFSIGTDTLFPNQTIVHGQTLISQSQMFEVGFFSRGASANSFLGIWYRNTPDVVCWVANRNDPIRSRRGIFSYRQERVTSYKQCWKGYLVSEFIRPGGFESNFAALDTGNLVVVDEGGESSSQESYIWQSFDYPSDTRLPGIHLVDDPDTGQEKYLTAWRNPDDPSPGNFTYRIENQGLAELVIFQGTTKKYRSGQWNGLGFTGVPPSLSPGFNSDFKFKNDVLVSMFEIYNYSIFARLTIEPSGFVQRYSMNEKKDTWNLVFTLPRDPCDNYGQCGPYGICSTDKTPIWVKFPDMLKFWLNTSMNIGECQAECLKNCNCTAYANPYITDGRSGCLIWYGDLIDIREVYGADSKQIVIFACRFQNWKIEETSTKEKSGFGITFVQIINDCCCDKNFSSGNMIGEGGFGPVYKVFEEFKNEVILIAKLQHRNLVRLLGCCIEREERLLIYEYMQNGSLDYFVFDETRRKLLTWPKRFDIIMGIARGLLYLHHDSRLRIIHRDLKTSNILLDANLNPKISDFGLARTSGGDQNTDRTKRVVGTYGYMAPEYAIDGKFSVKSDVFSMGVLLLEIVSGKRNRGFNYSNHHHSLLGHAWLLWQENKDLELIDECLNDTFVESQEVGAVLPQPKQPGFFMEGSCNNSAENHTPDTESNKGSITITELEPR